MTTNIAKGIELLSDKPGSGTEAVKGSSITYNARFFLRRGAEVTIDAKSIALYGTRLTTRSIDGVQLIDHITTLGRRQSIAGVEKSRYGMKSGGQREILVSPHLAYGKKGLADLIPADAMLRIQLWVHDVH